MGSHRPREAVAAWSVLCHAWTVSLALVMALLTDASANAQPNAPGKPFDLSAVIDTEAATATLRWTPGPGAIAVDYVVE